MFIGGGVIFTFCTLFFTFTSAAQQLQVTESPNDSCFMFRSFGQPIVIHFSGYDRCYLPLGDEYGATEATPVRFRGSATPSTITSLSVTKDESVFSFIVNPDADYEILSTSTCGTDAVVARFSTKNVPPSMISVSADAMNAAEQWQHDPQGENFYQMVVSNPFIDVVEKIYLLQQVLNQGAALDPIHDTGDIPPPEAFRVPIDCSCLTLELRGTRDVDEYEECLQFPNFICTKETYETIENFAYRIRYQSHVEGPAKYERVFGGYKNCNTKTFQAMEKSRKGIAILRYSMSCIDGKWDPADCRCEQPVNVRYSYRSTLFTKAEVAGAWTCSPIFPPNKAEAYADDAAIMLKLPNEYDINNGSFDIDSLHRLTLFNGCGVEIDKDRFGDLVGFTFEAIKLGSILKGGKDKIGIEKILNALKADKATKALKTYLTNMVTQPWVINEGECTSQQGQLLLEGQKIYTLKVDEPLAVALITVSNVRAGGQDAWRVGEGKVVSGYRLSGVIPKERSTPEAPFCCTPALGNYILGSMGHINNEANAPNIAVLRNKVGVHLMDIAGSEFTNTLNTTPTFGGYIINNELASVAGKVVPGCKTTISGRDITPPSSQKEPQWNIFADGSSLYIAQNSSIEQFSFRVFDMQGRLVTQGQNINEQVKGIDMQNASNGYYQIVITNGRESETIKYPYFRN